VFLGAIGGFVAMGTIGLFVGSIVLCVGYQLFLAWMEGSTHVSPELPGEPSASARAA
jgi:predicted PurR-regulated permease PerM